MTMFMVLSLWHSHWKSLLGSCDVSSMSAWRPPTFGPNRLTWAADLPKLSSYVPKWFTRTQIDWFITA